MNFVTGGSGLLGTRLIFDLISKGEDVIALRRTGTDLEMVKRVFEFLSPKGSELFSKINWTEGNIEDIYSYSDALSACQRVYHTAAVVSFHKKDAAQLKKINIQGTANIVNLCLEHGIEKMCHISSTAAIGRIKSGMRIDENSTWKDSRFNTRYAVSKYESEMHIWRGIAEGLEAVIVNPSVIIGPGSVERSSGALLKMIDGGMPFYPSGKNSFVSSIDVSRVCIELMDSEISNERFLVAGENLEFREVFNIIANSLQKKEPTIEAKKWMLRIGRGAHSIRETFGGPKASITKETVMTSGGSYYYDSNKVMEALDFEFTSVEDAVNEAVRFYKS